MGAKNAMAVSPNGKLIAIARTLNSKDLDNIPSLRNNKKAHKLALKYKMAVDFLDSQTLEVKYSCVEALDIVFDLKFTRDSKKLLVFNKAHTKIDPNVTKSYINVVDASNGELDRAMFASFHGMPDFKENPASTMFGVVTRDTDNWYSCGSIMFYDFETARTLGKFDIDLRFTLKIEEGGGNGRTYFTFLPNGQILSSYGVKLAYITTK